jgi:hypothetical protein
MAKHRKDCGCRVCKPPPAGMATLRSDEDQGPPPWYAGPAEERFKVLVNKYSHAGSSFARDLYEGETFSRAEADRLADERAALEVDRFVIVVDSRGTTVYCPTARR